MSLSNKIILNSLAQTAGQVLIYGLGAVASILAIRYLGPEDFGKYSLVLVYVGTIGSIVDFGGQIVLVREFNQRPNLVGLVLGNYLLVKTVFTLLVCASGAVVVGYLGYEADVRIFVLVGILALLLSLPATVSAVFQARLQMWFWAGINVIGKVIALAGVLIMIYSGGGIAVLMWTNVIVALFMSALAWFLIRRHEPPMFTYDRAIVRDLIVKTIPIGILLIAGGLIVRADTFLLSKLADNRAIGLYSAAYKFVDWGLMIIGGLLISHLPLFSKFVMTEPDKVRRLYQVTFDAVGLLVIPCATFGVLASRQIIVLFSGAVYGEGWIALTLLWWVLLLNTWNTMSINLLLALRETRIVLGMYLVTLAAVVIVNYYGIRHWGFTFCALTAVLREAVTLTILTCVVRDRIGLRVRWRKILRSLVANCVAVTPLLLSGERRLAVIVPAFVVLTLAANFLVGAVTTDELRGLANRLRAALGR